ncbi:MAG TPA: hypothetical protein DIU15_06080 [Deltaproteobacteria bacterium]|nr:hypothetical protein [Deltaproteobacteria bacterium]
MGYAVLAGPDPRYQAGLGQPPPHLSQLHNGDLSGIRIGVYRPWFEDAQAPLVAACQETLERFQAAGAEIIDIEIPDLELGRLAHTVSIGSEMATAREEGWDQHRKDYGLDVRVNLTIARTFSASDYVRAQQARTRMSHIFGDLLRSVDVVATPTTGITAPLIPEDALPAGQSDLETLSIIMRFAFPANLCGLPAIAFPVGYDPQGLPISFQAMGGPWQEHTLLRLAVLAEQWLERRKPAVHFDLLP